MDLYDPALVTPFDDDFFIHGNPAAEMHRFHKYQLLRKIAKIDQVIEMEQASIAVLSASILQIAKQGLSFVYGKPHNWPQGREVLPGIYLKDFIKYGRNHSQHYEEQDNQEASESDLIEKYTKNKERKEIYIPSSANEWIVNVLNPQLEHKLDWKQNQAYKFLQLMGWDCYENYKNDMSKM